MPIISNYHQKHLNRSDEETKRRALIKEEELRRIFSETSYAPPDRVLRIAVLGCADKRFVRLHREIFGKLLNRTIELTTFDITIDHLAGEPGVIKHDCTLPLPYPPYDLTFGHVLLKFIEPEKQWDVVKNSAESLQPSGLAIHVFDREDVETSARQQRDGYYSVNFENLKQKLTEVGMAFRDLRWAIKPEKMPIFIRGVEGGALVIYK